MKSQNKIMAKIFLFCSIFVLINNSKAQTIPNYDFENWQYLMYFDSATEWTTNNTYHTSATEVMRDSISYHGNYAMKLINTFIYRAWAQVKFPITTHPLNLIGYLKCNLADSTDTVTIKITMMNNGLLVDSGVWFGISSISDYIKVTIPISQNTSIIDSAIIVIVGGNHLTNNQLGMGTELWVDYLSLNFKNEINDTKKNEALFKILPNPAQEYFFILLNKASYTPDFPILLILYDLMGKKIKSWQMETSVIKIETSDVSSGTYFLKIQTGQRIEINKLIKQ